ncbi:Uncharacterised protein [Streptococcus pneumoniae]|nr:Uncharacterised protein [Streptococcus pneumoniae]
MKIVKIFQVQVIPMIGACHNEEILLLIMKKEN